MFTGIITDIGEVIAIEKRGDTRLAIATSYDPDTIALGASIACSGCCLTAVEIGRLQDGRGFFAVDASAETLARTTLGSWRIGTRINL
jgi:riboflavin synthase